MLPATKDDLENSQPPLLANHLNGDGSDEKKDLKNEESDLLYSVEDVPPWYLSIFFGFQHYVTLAGGTVAIPLMLSGFLCMAEDDPARGALVSTVLFHSGLVTLLQSTFGVRLPIVHGGDFAYMVPTIALLTTVYKPCSDLPLANMTLVEREETWQVRMREVQGSILLASLFQITLGFTGLVGIIISCISPLTIVPTVSLVGLSLFDVAADKAALHWGISAMTILLMILFSQYLRNVKVPLPVASKKRGYGMTNFRIFMCFSVLLTVCVMWIICWILTISEFLPSDSPARTDVKGTILSNSPWFRVPYPGQWGTPIFSVAGVVGMLSGVVASIIESVGDYYACARISGAPPPPVSAINRGIVTEGIGGLLAGLLGTGNGTTSASQNIGAIGVTKVGSRRVVQFTALILVLSGIFGKIGGIFVSIPEPIMAGIFIIMFAMIFGVGLAPLCFVDMNSSRNLFVLGFSIFFGLALPKWLEYHPGSIQTGLPMLDQVLSICLQIPMLVGGFLGCFLDNTVPGTLEERGLLRWRELHQGKQPNDLYQPSRCYDLPLGMDLIRRVKWLHYVPFSPTFKGFTQWRKEHLVNDA